MGTPKQKTLSKNQTSIYSKRIKSKLKLIKKRLYKVKYTYRKNKINFKIKRIISKGFKRFTIKIKLQKNLMKKLFRNIDTNLIAKKNSKSSKKINPDKKKLSKYNFSRFKVNIESLQKKIAFEKFYWKSNTMNNY